MDKALKELIAQHKLSDEQILEALKKLVESSSTNNDSEQNHKDLNDNTPSKEGVEENPTTEESAAESTPAVKEVDLKGMIEAILEEKLKTLPKPQPPIIPTFKNENKPKQWKKLK